MTSTPQSEATPEMVEIVARAMAVDPISIEREGHNHLWLVIDWENSPDLFRALARRAIAALAAPQTALQSPEPFSPVSGEGESETGAPAPTSGQGKGIEP